MFGASCPRIEYYVLAGGDRLPGAGCNPGSTAPTHREAGMGGRVQPRLYCAPTNREAGMGGRVHPGNTVPTHRADTTLQFADYPQASAVYISMII